MVNAWWTGQPKYELCLWQHCCLGMVTAFLDLPALTKEHVLRRIICSTMHELSHCLRFAGVIDLDLHIP